MIDPKLQAELRAKYNPDGSDLRKMQLRMLDMLKYIDKICRENDIKYWLSSGTCLGAVRHGGFIPWDDDCDIEMLEEDYIKFVEVMGKQKSDTYVLQTLNNDKTYVYPFGKLRDLKSEINEVHGVDTHYKYRGCFIDIFYIVPSNSLKLFWIGNSLWWEEMRLKEQCLLSNKSNIRYELIKKINPILLYLIKKITSLNSNGKLRHCLGNGFPKARFKKDIFPLSTTFFEGWEFPIPGNVDTYLRRIYNDYENLPNINDIEVHLNDFKIWE